ncbi:MAG: spore cortex biosynthesis protein YabQ [Oscillospiraceae bacterium]|jgi:hypothetical protein|nr:spore cortex biosynthesis protein YabQ [Oscillospiraceae bacterium]
MHEPIYDSLSQLSSFAVLGFFLAVFYEIIRIVRLFRKQSDLAVGITDFLFLSVSGLITFAYALELGSGYFRWFYIAGLTFGAAVYFLTIGQLVSLASNLIVRFVKRILSLAVKYSKRTLAVIIEFLLLPAYRKVCVFIQFLQSKIGNISVFLRKSAKNVLNHLKSRFKVLYNKRTARVARVKQVKSSENSLRGDKRNVIKGKIRNASVTFRKT